MKRSVRCVVDESGIGIFCFLSQFVNSALSDPFRSACSETTFILTSLPQTNSRGLALMEFPFLTSVNNGDSSKLTFRPNLTSPPRAIVHGPCMCTLDQGTAVYFKCASPGTNVTSCQTVRYVEVNLSLCKRQRNIKSGVTCSSSAILVAEPSTLHPGCHRYQ